MRSEHTCDVAGLRGFVAEDLRTFDHEVRHRVDVCPVRLRSGEERAHRGLIMIRQIVVDGPGCYRSGADESECRERIRMVESRR